MFVCMCPYTLHFFLAGTALVGCTSDLTVRHPPPIVSVPCMGGSSQAEEFLPHSWYVFHWSNLIYRASFTWNFRISATDTLEPVSSLISCLLQWTVYFWMEPVHGWYSFPDHTWEFVMASVYSIVLQIKYLWWTSQKGLDQWIASRILPQFGHGNASGILMQLVFGAEP